MLGGRVLHLVDHTGYAPRPFNCIRYLKVVNYYTLAFRRGYIIRFVCRPGPPIYFQVQTKHADI